jgi:hypothetical protein
MNGPFKAIVTQPKQLPQQMVVRETALKSKPVLELQITVEEHKTV